MSFEGRTPQMMQIFEPYRGRDRQIYVTIAELANWARAITAQTQEGEPYHDAKEIFEDAEDAIAAFFDGSMGTYVDIMTGETKSYPEIADVTDIEQMFYDDYNTRLVYYPLFNLTNEIKEKNNDRWYVVLTHWANRVKRFCKFNKIRYQKLIQTMMIEYNPIADYWTKEKEIGANSPYISISNNKSSQVGPAEDMTVDDWNQDTAHADGYTTETTNSADANVTNKHYTTTYDDAAESRLESYDVQTGGTKSNTTSQSPNSGYFKKREEEGNKGTVSPQDMVVKEFDIAQLWNIVELFMKDLSKEIFLQVYWTP